MTAILERYIAKTIFLATGLTTLIIVGVLFLMTLLGELKNIGEGYYGITEAIFYVFLRLPNSLYEFSPIIILLGCMTGLSILSSYRDLALMRSCGFSIRRMSYSVLSAALLILIGVTFIGERFGPHLSYSASVRKESARNAGQVAVTAAGVWFHVGNNFIHVQHVIDRQRLEGVTRYQFDDNHRLQAAHFAKVLALQDNQWQMQEGVKTLFYNERTKSVAYPQAAWDLKFNANLLNIGLTDPKEMSLSKLFKFVHYLKNNGLQASEYEYDFWQRIFQPLASLIMVFLAIPFVLGVFSTTTLGWQILAGVLMGFAFFILNAFLGQLCIVYQLPPMFAASLPLVLFAMVGVFLARCLIRR